MMSPFQLCFLLLLLDVLVTTSHGFQGQRQRPRLEFGSRTSCRPPMGITSTTPSSSISISRSSLVLGAMKQKDSDPAALTDFLAKAHEEKIAALGRMEAKYKSQIDELQARVKELEQPTVGASANSFAFPATNKEMGQKVAAYRTFLSHYVVKSQQEKAQAVQAAEAKLIAKYEATIDGLSKK